MTMPATDFNVPRGSFPTPIKPIGVGPLVGPLVEVRFNYKWCKVIVGSLSQLLLNTTWDTASLDELSAIQQDVFDLMASFCVDPPPAGFTPNTGADGGDDFMLRQNPDNPCELQTSVDGVNWCTWADLSKCEPQVTQPAGGTPQPTPGGGCQTYHAILPSSGKWLLPYFVSSGDVMTIRNLKGASNDGTLSPWYCGDGGVFLLGFCDGSSTTSSSDPIPTSPHLSLIAHVGGLYIPVLGGPITIGAVGVGQQLEFQVNDSILSDNSGSLEFDVEICNNQDATWSHVLDLRASSLGFAGDGWIACSSGSMGDWTPGQGLTQGYCLNSITHYEQVSMEVLFSSNINIDSVAYLYDVTVDPLNAGTDIHDIITYRDTGGTQHTSTDFIGGDGTAKSIGDTTPRTIKAIGVRIGCGSVDTPTTPTGTARVYQLTVSGHGTDPFA